MEDQVASIWMGTNGFLDDIEITDVLDFEHQLLDYLHAHSQVLGTIASTGLLAEDTEAELRRVVTEFHEQWLSARSGGPAEETDGEAAETEHSREEIVRGRSTPGKRA